MSIRAWETLYADPSWAERVFYLFITSPHFVLPVLPFLALLVVAIHVKRLRADRGSERPSASQYHVLCGAFIVGLTLSAISTGRPDFDHLLYLAPPLFLVFAWIFQEGSALPSYLLERTRVLLAVFVLVSFTAFGLAFWLRGAVTARHPLETPRGTIRVASPDDVVPFLVRHTRPGSRIFVYPYQPLYYFLSATSNPTGYEYLQLGMHSSEQMSEAIQELAAMEPPIAVFAPSFNYQTLLQSWPATPEDAVGRDLVRDYILSNYRLCRPLASHPWVYFFMVRDGLECPK
jgi:hypothetical protein